MSSMIKNIIIILVIAGVGFFGYNYLTKSDTSSGALIEQGSLNTSKMGAEVLTALNQLKTIKLDSGIFKDSVFVSLKDFSKPLIPEPVGRINPFNPIGVESGSVKTNPSSSTTKATSNGLGN